MKTMKRLAGCLLALCLLLALAPRAQAAGTVRVSRSTSEVYVNDQKVQIAGYNIGGNNYYRLRDLAAALAGTASRFDVGWNQRSKRVELTRGTDYTGGAETARPAASADALPSPAELVIDGRRTDAAAYNIGGSNYYRLRDLGEALSFAVTWVQASDSVCVYTGVGDGLRLLEGGGGAAMRSMNRGKSTQRWSETCVSYLYGGGGTYTVVDASGAKTVTADTYDGGTWALTGSRQIPMELDLFGGFFAGEQYNYMVFGSNNVEENDRREVLRVVKYDKDFNRLASVSVTGGECGATKPFDAGTTRMCERGGELVIHSSREQYASADGIHHESQLTLVVDTERMAVKNQLGQFQGNHVSHSFNQFAQYDGESHVLVDHGDGYPRSIVLNRYAGGTYTAVDLFEIPGAVGANCTGVTLGGFEVSGENYLVAINTVDHSKVRSYDSYELQGLELDERDVVLLVSGKGNTSAAGVSRIALTGYIGQGKLGSTPYLVKLGQDRFLVLWEEFDYGQSGSSYNVADNGVRCVQVDGGGRPLGEVRALPFARLSYDCQPVYLDGAVSWYVNAMGGRLLYSVSP